MEYEIQLRNISKTYHEFLGNEVKVLDKISYCFEKGKFYAIMGVSGAGKSTLLHIIGLLDKADGGELLIEGEKTENLTSDQMADLRMKKIGFVFQDYYLNPRLTVKDNIILAMKINKEIKKKDYDKRINELMSMLHLEGLLRRYPKELSGGEQQRVCIARALANEPEIILADEPTGNLDNNNEINVLNHLKSLSKNGKTVIVVTHNDVVKEYADEVYYLEKLVEK